MVLPSGVYYIHEPELNYMQVNQWVFCFLEYLWKVSRKREFIFNINLNILNLSSDKCSISAFLSCCSWSLPIMFLISAQQPGFLSYITLKFQGNVLASNLTLPTVFFLVWCLVNMIGLIVFHITACETPLTSKGLHMWKIWLMVIQDIFIFFLGLYGIFGVVHE